MNNQNEIDSVRPCIVCGSERCMYVGSPNSMSLVCDACGGLRIAAYSFVVELQAKIERLEKLVKESE